jgi:hypothetical protein
MRVTDEAAREWANATNPGIGKTSKDLAADLLDVREALRVARLELAAEQTEGKRLREELRLLPQVVARPAIR